jgi:hypothetical protein
MSALALLQQASRRQCCAFQSAMARLRGAYTVERSKVRDLSQATGRFAGSSGAPTIAACRQANLSTASRTCKTLTMVCCTCVLWCCPRACFCTTLLRDGIVLHDICKFGRWLHAGLDGVLPIVGTLLSWRSARRLDLQFTAAWVANCIGIAEVPERNTLSDATLNCGSLG